MFNRRLPFILLFTVVFAIVIVIAPWSSLRPSKAAENLSIDVLCSSAHVSGTTSVAAPFVRIRVTLASNLTMQLAEVTIPVEAVQGASFAADLTYALQNPDTLLIVSAGEWDGSRYLRPAAMASKNCVSSTPSESATAIPIVPIRENGQWTPVIQRFNGVDMAMVPPGCFLMGTVNPPAPESPFGDEQPATRICFDRSWWIDLTEVTQGQFKALGGIAAASSDFPGDNHPVEQIAWFEARDFCARRGARLPSEAEWEYAARGPDNLVFPWGNTFDASKVVANRSQTDDVGSLPGGASWVGALDMSGNVAEWTNSKFGPYPYAASDGRESLENEANSSRVLRGGSWMWDGVNFLRAALRLKEDPTYARYSVLGFRCARS